MATFILWNRRPKESGLEDRINFAIGKGEYSALVKQRWPQEPIVCYFCRQDAFAVAIDVTEITLETRKEVVDIDATSEHGIRVKTFLQKTLGVSRGICLDCITKRIIRMMSV